MQRGKKKASKLVQLAKEWCANSALHGVKYVGEDGTHKCEKIMWVLLVSGAASLALYMCWSYWTKWERSPILTSVQSTTFPLNDVPFPAFTICNVNKVSSLRLRKVLTNPRYNGISYEDMKLALRIMTKPDLALPSKFLNKTNELALLMQKNNINTTELLYIMKKSQTPCQEILADCTWQDEPIECNTIFIGRATDDGYCCSFNVKHVSLYVPEVNMTVWDAFFEETKKASIKSANLRSFGTSLNVNTDDSDVNATNTTNSEDSEDLPETVPLAETKINLDTNSAGIFAGLTVVLDSAREDYSSVMTNFDGFKVLLHAKEEFPDVSDRGFILGIDSAVNIGVEPVMIEADKSIESVRFDKRNCYYKEEAKLNFFDTYATSSCLMECVTEKTIANIGCRPYFYPDKLPELAFALAKVRASQDKECPQCHPECTEIIYKAHISTAPFPGKAFPESALYRRLRSQNRYNDKKMNDTDFVDYVTKNMIPVTLYFHTKVAMKYAMEVRYAWEDFVSAMGGLLGFGLGFSIIACFEMFYFICLRWCFDREQRIRPGSSATLALKAALQNQPDIFHPMPQQQPQRAHIIPMLPESPKLHLRRRRYAYDALGDDIYPPAPLNIPNVIVQHVPVPMAMNAMPMPAFQPMFMMPTHLPPQTMNYNPPYTRK